MTTFNRAEFAGSTVSFRYARFTSDRVDFPSARFIGGEVSFEHASGMCPDRLLESIEQGESGVVILPDSWQADSEQTPPMPLRESRRNSARSE
jgi:hypothetical protein